MCEASLVGEASKSAGEDLCVFLGGHEGTRSLNVDVGDVGTDGGSGGGELNSGLVTQFCLC